MNIDTIALAAYLTTYIVGGKIATETLIEMLEERFRTPNPGFWVLWIVLSPWLFPTAFFIATRNYIKRK